MNSNTLVIAQDCSRRIASAVTVSELRQTVDSIVETVTGLCEEALAINDSDVHRQWVLVHNHVLAEYSKRVKELTR